MQPSALVPNCHTQAATWRSCLPFCVVIKHVTCIVNCALTCIHTHTHTHMAFLQVTSSQDSRTGSKMSEQQDDIAAAMQLCIQPNVDRTRQHCSSLRNSPCQHARKDTVRTESLMKQGRLNVMSQPQSNRRGYMNDMHTLCRDMQHLDAELADLDAGLTSASHKCFW